MTVTVSQALLDTRHRQLELRRAELPEPELFRDRSADLTQPAKKLTPLRLSKVAGGSGWQVRYVYLLTVRA